MKNKEYRWTYRLLKKNYIENGNDIKSLVLTIENLDAKNWAYYMLLLCEDYDYVKLEITKNLLLYESEEEWYNKAMFSEEERERMLYGAFMLIQNGFDTREHTYDFIRKIGKYLMEIGPT